MRCALKTLRVAMILVAAQAQVSCGNQSETGSEVLYGFTNFPQQLSDTALEEVRDLIAPISNFYTIHGDNGCAPWSELLADVPVPQWVEDDWREIRGLIPRGHTVGVSITPTLADRVTMLPQCGASANAPVDLPSELAGMGFDSDAMKTAYVRYALRMISEFSPTYLVLGIEISEMSLSAPETWPEFEALFLHTSDEVRKVHPTVKVGLELVLQSLLVPRVANQVKASVEHSDFVGISFYPYGSEFGEKFGAPALEAPPRQWREPLDWLRGYTSKPVGIWETGYTTVTRTVQDVNFPGDAATQKAFLSDLVAIARRDGYLFVDWFVPVDYERLLEQNGAGPNDVGWIWANAGLFDRDLKPKPAFDEWQRFLRN